MKILNVKTEISFFYMVKFKNSSPSTPHKELKEFEIKTSLMK